MSPNEWEVLRFLDPVTISITGEKLVFHNIFVKTISRYVIMAFTKLQIQLYLPLFSYYFYPQVMIAGTLLLPSQHP